MRRPFFIPVIVALLTGCVNSNYNNGDLKSILQGCKKNLQLLQKIDVAKYNIYHNALKSWSDRAREENTLRDQMPAEALKIIEPLHNGQIRKLCFSINAEVVAVLITRQQ